MRKAATIFAAASLAVAGMGIAGCQNQNPDGGEATGSTHGGVRTGTTGVAGRNPSQSPSLSGSRMGTTGTGTTGAQTAGARGTVGAGGGAGGAGIGAAGGAGAGSGDMQGGAQ